MACAVPRKRPDLNPSSLVERMPRNWDLAVRRNAANDRLVLTDELSLEEIGAGLFASLDEARMNLPDAPPESHGRLEVDGNGQPVVNRGFTFSGKWKASRPGGAVPSFEGIDGEMIAEFGPEGCFHSGVRQAESARGPGTGPFLRFPQLLVNRFGNGKVLRGERLPTKMHRGLQQWIYRGMTPSLRFRGSRLCMRVPAAPTARLPPNRKILGP